MPNAGAVSRADGHDEPMRRSVIVGTVVGVLLVGGVAAAAVVTANGGAAPSAVSSSVPPTPTPSASSTVTTPDAEPTESAEAAPAAAPGEYVEYSDAALAAVEGTPVLFFHAPWCPQCRALEESIETSGVPDGLVILKVDYDSRQDLRQRYGVTIQTTLVALDGAGEATASFVAYDDPSLVPALTGLGLVD